MYPLREPVSVLVGPYVRERSHVSGFSRRLPNGGTTQKQYCPISENDMQPLMAVDSPCRLLSGLSLASVSSQDGDPLLLRLCGPSRRSNGGFPTLKNGIPWTVPPWGWPPRQKEADVKSATKRGC